MAYTVANAVEPVSKAMLEGYGSVGYNSIPGGCAITFSSMDMTFDIGDGAAWVNGVYTLVPADTNVSGLTADTTYSTWEYIVVDDSGAASVVAGSPAANPAEPTIDYTQYTPVWAVLVPANQTIANTITDKYDKRVPWLYQGPQLTADFTKNANVTLSDIASLKWYMEATATYSWELIARASIPATPGIKIGLTVPASATASGQGILVTVSAIVADAQDDIISGHATHIELVPAATGIYIHLSGTVASNGTAGYAQIQGAQSVSDASDSTLVAVGSQFHVWRIA